MTNKILSKTQKTLTGSLLLCLAYAAPLTLTVAASNSAYAFENIDRKDDVKKQLPPQHKNQSADKADKAQAMNQLKTEKQATKAKADAQKAAAEKAKAQAKQSKKSMMDAKKAKAEAQKSK